MNHRMADQTYYEILEVAPDASQHEIHAAYHRARSTYSPDSPALYSMFTREEARDLMNLIEEAFSILSNQSKRKAYDKHLIREAHQSKVVQMGAANPGDDLPDFQVPESEMTTQPAQNPEIKVEKSEPEKMISRPSFARNKKESLPEGFGKTRFSIYQMDPNFENELKQTRVFDGSFLQKVRQYKQVNLDQIRQETRIARPYLIALEANSYESLPAPVFTRGFVVQVARILGLNEKLVADSYMSLYRNEKS
ncbi:MAG: helix-turn-helix domain-containing protein [Bdellovibrionales bacterium]|nr:helix-turn-helix domain-containing protein [Bdellovibrionales bacterium]